MSMRNPGADAVPPKEKQLLEEDAKPRALLNYSLYGW
jgi:hypothetical protein